LPFVWQFGRAVPDEFLAGLLDAATRLPGSFGPRLGQFQLDADLTSSAWGTSGTATWNVLTWKPFTVRRREGSLTSSRAVVSHSRRAFGRYAGC
jgi:hypothetical protein